MKRVAVYAFCAALFVAFAGLAQAEKKAAKEGSKSKPAAKCPVSGEDISKDASVDYKGGKVYFCCPGCISKFKKDTAKYQAKANEQLVLTGQAKQEKCPLSGGKVNPDTKLKVCGIEVCFCCKGCQGKVKNASPEKQCEMVFVKGFDKAFVIVKEKKGQEK